MAARLRDVDPSSPVASPGRCGAAGWPLSVVVVLVALRRVACSRRRRRSAGFSERIVDYRHRRHDRARRHHRGARDDRLRLRRRAHTTASSATIPVRIDQSTQGRLRPRLPARRRVGDAVRPARRRSTPSRTTATTSASRSATPTARSRGEHTYDIIVPRARRDERASPTTTSWCWNAVGNDWPVPIEQAIGGGARARPTSRRSRCFSGPFGSTLRVRRPRRARVRTAEFSETALGPYEGMTVVVALPKGAVAPSPEADPRGAVQLRARRSGSRPRPAASRGRLLVVLVGRRDLSWCGSSAATAATRARPSTPRSATRRRPRGAGAAPRERETPVEFVPPDGLRPGQVGTLIDFDRPTRSTSPPRSSTSPCAATSRSRSSTKEWSSSSTTGSSPSCEKDDAARCPTSGRCSTALFKRRRRGASCPTSRTRSPRAWARCASSSWTTRCRRAGSRRKPGTVKVLWRLPRHRRARRRRRAHGPAGGRDATPALLGVPVIVGGILLLIVVRGGCRSAPRRATRCCATRSGSSGSSTSRRRTGRSSPSAQNIFSEYLPYAVVFGATEKWAKAFEGLGRRRRHVVVVRVAARVQLRGLLERHRRLRHHQRGHAHVVTRVERLERVQRRWLLRRWRRWRWRRLLVASGLRPPARTGAGSPGLRVDEVAELRYQFRESVLLPGGACGRRAHGPGVRHRSVSGGWARTGAFRR